MPYALLEGIFLGGISVLYENVSKRASHGYVATFVTAAVMLGYIAQVWLKSLKKFRSIVTSAVIAIMLVYVAQWVLSLAFGSALLFLFEGGAIAIGFSLFVIVIASFTLFIRLLIILIAGVAMGVSEDYEWLFSIGILATLVWMYIEFMRLLSYL